MPRIVLTLKNNSNKKSNQKANIVLIVTAIIITIVVGTLAYIFYSDIIPNEENEFCGIPVPLFLFLIALGIFIIGLLIHLAIKHDWAGKLKKKIKEVKEVVNEKMETVDELVKKADDTIDKVQDITDPDGNSNDSSDSFDKDDESGAVSDFIAETAGKFLSGLIGTKSDGQVNWNAQDFPNPDALLESSNNREDNSLSSPSSPLEKQQEILPKSDPPTSNPFYKDLKIIIKTPRNAPIDNVPQINFVQTQNRAKMLSLRILFSGLAITIIGALIFIATSIGN